jgi:hypothetical protein
MELERTRFVLEAIDQHLQTGGTNPLIESYFAQYALVVFYSEAEQKLKDTVERRLDEVHDAKVSSFISCHRAGMLRRIKKEELNQLLSNFACGDGDLIGGELGEAEHQRYSTAIANRHQVSHGEGANMTLPEIRQAVDSAERVLAFVEQKLFE